MRSGNEPQHRPRTPGVIYLAVGLVLLVMLGVLALTSRQPPPPTIAEFAPQAVDQITNAPTDQGTSVGRGAGTGTDPADLEPTPAPQPTPINVPRVRRCVGDPPRQIEDPQSPPCVPYWQGNNGGATARGVTRDEIRIYIPEWTAIYPGLQAFFNNRFEFYGRQIHLIQGKDPGGSEAAQKAGAVAAESENVFASGERYNGNAYHTELARRGIVSAPRDGTFAEGDNVRLRPYLWSYVITVDKLLASMGEWTCKRLASKPARWGGDDVSSKTRVFGLFFQQLSAGSYSTMGGPIERELQACGEKLQVAYAFDQGTATDYSNALARMKVEGVTTIYLLAIGEQSVYPMAQANAQNYFPEWILTSYIQNDLSSTPRAYYPASQSAHSFGLTFNPREQPAEQNASTWAWTEGGGQSGGGLVADNIRYRNLLLLASGIQMAGPNLTAATFEAGLHRATFPNPAHPIMAGAVGFEDGDHSMTNDAAEMWWSSTDRDAQGQPGRWCYADGAARYRKGRWPEGDPPLFTGSCESPPPPGA